MQSFMWAYFLLEDAVQRVFQQLPVLHAVDREVLRAVVHPDVHDARVALRLAHLLGDGAAAACARSRIRGLPGSGFASERSPDLGCENDVELKSSFMPLAFAQSIQPWKWFGLHPVAVDELAAEFAVDLVEVQAVLAGMSDLALRMSARSSSMLRALPGSCPWFGCRP